MSTGRPLRITKQQTTIFGDSLKYRCRRGFDQLFEVVTSASNTKSVRDQRKQAAFSDILAQLLNAALQIQNSFTAGWSKEYQLDMHQKYWLDPNRAQMVDEDDFAWHYASGDWITELETQFARWINAILKAKFDKVASHFDDAEVSEWQREFSAAVKASQRNKQGIF